MYCRNPNIRIRSQPFILSPSLAKPKCLDKTSLASGFTKTNPAPTMNQRVSAPPLATVMPDLHPLLRARTESLLVGSTQHELHIQDYMCARVFLLCALVAPESHSNCVMVFCKSADCVALFLYVATPHASRERGGRAHAHTSINIFVLLPKACKIKVSCNKHAILCVSSQHALPACE